jgi:hypothetical protein
MRARFDARAAALRPLALLTALGLGCADPRPTEPTAAPDFARGGGTGPTVTATSPSFGEQGTASLDVQITGSGFDQGSQAAWDSGGAPYPRITVNSTKFVSSTQLLANISIAPNAAIQYYDVAVATSTGKKGIGTELFTVTLADSIPGATDAFAVNDAGRVTGTDAAGIYVYDIGTGVKQDIGFTGTVWTIDQAGVTLGGTDAATAASNHPLIWTNAGGTWSQTTLPDLGQGGAVRGGTSDGSAGPGVATRLVGSVFRVVTCKGGITCISTTPAVWSRGTSGAWTLSTLPYPRRDGFAKDINASGMAVGMEGTNCCLAMYWDADGALTTLPPLVAGAASAAWAINKAGTIIVGNSNAVAVAWTRATTSDPWTTPTPLEDTSRFCSVITRGNNITSVAYAINEAGIIVGQSCNVAVAWRPSGSGYSRILLGDLGNHPATGLARAINNAASPIAVGTAGQGVYWHDF